MLETGLPLLPVLQEPMELRQGLAPESNVRSALLGSTVVGPPLRLSQEIVLLCITVLKDQQVLLLLFVLRELTQLLEPASIEIVFLAHLEKLVLPLTP